LSGDSTRSLANVKKELFRKSIHIFGFSIPLISIAAGNLFAVLLIVSLSILYAVSEYFRLRGKSFPLLTTVTEIAMRNDIGEGQRAFVKEPLYFAAGILASLLIFPAPFNYVAIAVVTLGDGFASVIGRMYGKHRIPYSGGKSIEGTAAGIACAFAGALLFTSPTIALIAALAGMAIELVQLRVSDNLTVPFAAGFVATIVGGNF
jgi:dolichol kinase